MKKYVAFLRGINVGGHRKINMAELREAVEKAGFQEVKTYIQSGNLVISSEINEESKIKTVLENLISEQFGLEVQVIVFEKEEIEEIIARNPFHTTEPNLMYFIFLQEIPDDEKVAQMNEVSLEGESFFYEKRTVYLKLQHKYHESKFTHQHIEKILKVKATARNLNTCLKIAELLR